MKQWAEEANTHLRSRPSSGALNGALRRRLAWAPFPHRPRLALQTHMAAVSERICERSLTMSTVLYARVPDSLKQALDAHRSARGLTMTRAVVELLEHGLEASADKPRVTELEGKLAACARERAQTRTRLREAELRL
jgi:hypothetical protein